MIRRYERDRSKDVRAINLTRELITDHTNSISDSEKILNLLL